MKNLFGDEETKRKVSYRDRYGRFTTKDLSKYERALQEANYYKQMYLKSESRMRGMSKILRFKDETINNLKKRLKNEKKVLDAINSRDSNPNRQQNI